MSTQHVLIGRARIFLLLVLAALAVGRAHALDTDVYLKSQVVSRNDAPRVLIVFDNSGSMATIVDETRVRYNPSINYCTDDLDARLNIPGANDGKPSGCGSRAGRIYWSFGTPRRPPATNSGNWFTASKNKCLASLNSETGLNTTGMYSGTKIAKWRSGNNGGGWRSLSGANDNSITYVDCEADNASSGNATHDGLTLDDGQRPRASNNTAYDSTGQEFVWSNFTSNATPTLYTSNYMDMWNNPVLVQSRTRLEIAQSAIKDVVDSNPTFWMGLMTFNYNDDADSNQNGEHGGRIVQSIQDLNTPGLRTQFKAHVDNLGADTWTPLAETLWEAYRYWAGLSVDYGDNNSSNIAPPRDNNAQNPPGSGNYVSPLSYACQTGYIVYVTDGDPTKDGAADSKIKALPGLSSSTCAHNDATPLTSCLKDLAGWMHTNFNGISGAQAQKVITYTIGFGTGMSDDGRELLNQTAQRGGGEFLFAQNADELTVALETIFVKILSHTTSFTAPSLSINAFDRQFNRDEVYLSLFKPSNDVAWAGNIKRYRLCNSADIAARRCDHLSELVDRDNEKITGPDNKILDTARSFWSDSDDGSNVTRGGAGSVVPAYASRNMYTYYAANYSGLTGPSTASPGVEVKSGNMTNPFYAAVAANPTLLGLPATATSTEVNALIEWIRGRDTYDADEDLNMEEGRWAMGDVLHSRATAITYGCVDGTPTTSSQRPCASNAVPIMKLFVGSNDGTIRMINSATGVEEWSFLPKEMYANQHAMAQNASGDHIYGMDNTVSFWVRDNNRDSIIDPAEDKVFMYVTMRRGGRNIYAFDVTPQNVMISESNTLTPKLMWVIEGGSGDFAKLGQTWSVPRIARIRYKCTGSVCDDGNPTTSDAKSRVVLIFAGGYSPDQDNSIPGPTDTMGNAIYIVDPFTGARIWWASDAGATLNSAKMKYAIPSDLTLLDTDRDDNIDRIYVGDMAGQLWRIDLGTQLEANVLDVGTKGYVFADVGCGSTSTARVHDTNGACPTGTALQDRRKFFYPPSVARAKDTHFSTTADYDIVAIGSGDREDPLDLLTTNQSSASNREAVHNRIYVFRDHDIRTGPAPDSDTSSPSTWESPAPLTEAALYDATTDTIGTAPTTSSQYTTAVTDLKGKRGWFINLKRSSAITVPNGLTTTWVGEKVLARTTLLDGTLTVTTFTPPNDTNVANICDAREGVATLYNVNVLNAAATSDFDKDGVKERSEQIGGGIPSEAVPVIRPDGTTGLVTGGGAAPVEAELGLRNNVWRNYWVE